MGQRLTLADEGRHAVGEELNWNESRYLDFLDRTSGLGGWLRIGNRPNEGHAEMSVCVYLPDGGIACRFDRPPIEGNPLAVEGQSWEVIEPYAATRVRFGGDLRILPDPWLLVDPKRAFASSTRVDCQIDLLAHAQDLGSVMGADQDHISRIFLPGQAASHYQHLVRTSGQVSVGNRRWQVAGLGGKDHSWGPRNWHAKTSMRWLSAMSDDDFGFMVTRAVGPTKQTRGGFVWDHGTFRLVDDFELRNVYAAGPHHELLEAAVVIHADGLRWTATGTPTSWVPLRHRQPGPDGNVRSLRIVKSPTLWTIDHHLQAAGMCEYHDLVEGDLPIVLDEC